MLRITEGRLAEDLIALQKVESISLVERITQTYNNIDCLAKTPSLPYVLRCVELQPDQVRVMIIGQDPYPAYGAATGLAFSINRFVSEKSSGQSVYKLAQEIYRSMGYPLPDKVSGNLDHWQAQGVMLLNSALTTKTGDCGSHIEEWRTCVHEIVTDYVRLNSNIIVVCLGARARDLIRGINIRKVICKDHPNARPSNIQGSDLFIEINTLLGDYAIDWRLTEEIQSLL
jgi:uracil-DNA glycosylase